MRVAALDSCERELARRRLRRQFPATVSFFPSPVQKKYSALIGDIVFNASTTKGGSFHVDGNTRLLCVEK